MVTFLISSLFLVAVIAVAVYFWQKPPKHVPQIQAPPNSAHGLFENTLTELPPAENETSTTLSERAAGGDQSVLLEAHKSQDPRLYQYLLTMLLSKSESPANLLSLVSYVTRHELTVPRELAEAFTASSKNNLDRATVAKVLHLAAMSDDAATYQNALETALHAYQSNKLLDVSALELQALFTGEFWVLSSRARSSGAGFILKRALASARRQLET
ncbi:MAG: hypothetical protein ABR555_07860 [Pyrinomonadaceae bacterium]